MQEAFEGLSSPNLSDLPLISSPLIKKKSLFQKVAKRLQALPSRKGGGREETLARTTWLAGPRPGFSLGVERLLTSSDKQDGLWVRSPGRWAGLKARAMEDKWRGGDVAERRGPGWVCKLQYQTEPPRDDPLSTKRLNGMVNKWTSGFRLSHHSGEHRI